MNTTELILFAAGSTTLDPTTFAPNGARGADKVAQRVVYALLTPSGTVPGRPNDGCPFLDLASSFSSEFDLFTAFAGSLSALITTVQAAEDNDDLDSERVGEVRLAGIDLTAGDVTLTLAVTTRDQSSPAKTIDFVLQP